MADRVVQDGISIREVAGREGSDVTGPGDSAEISYLCKGSTDPLECRAALFAQTFYNVNSYDGLILKSVNRTRLSNTAWNFTLGYGNVPEVSGYTISIDTTGATVVQQEAFFNNQYPASGKSMSDNGTSINVQGDDVQGIDRVIGALKINVNAKIAQTWVSSPIAYAKTIASLTGYVNNAPYLGFATGELLFLGASGDIIANGDPALTFTFAASQNLTGLALGNISGIAKGGHEYLWVEYQTESGGTGEGKKQIAVGANVATIYEPADFTILRIGQ